jgi:hypothetical protein
MKVGRCSQCGGDVLKDMEGNLRCRECGSFKPAGPVIPMPPPKPPRGFPPPDRGDWRSSGLPYLCVKDTP